jgi:hypothetical protein
VKFYYFHLMPYVMEHDEPSSWVTLSNRHYDPKRWASTLYNQYLDQLEHAERLGWDGLCVNEHHQNCYGTMPSPNVMAAMLVRRTTRAKIAILGNGLPSARRTRCASPRRSRCSTSPRAARHLRLRARHQRRVFLDGRQSDALRGSASTRRAALILRPGRRPARSPSTARFYRYPLRESVAAPALSSRIPPVWCPSQGLDRDGGVGRRSGASRT